MLSIGEIVNASNGTLINGNEKKQVKGYKIDSRIIEKDEFYIPMLGEKVDGHIFINDVVQKGACGFFVKRGTKIDLDDILKISPEVGVVEVEDTLTALQDIARYNRQKHIDIESISITGSVGKTSTRQMVAAVLSQAKKLLVTENNLNGHIGLPLMALKIDSQDLILLETGIDFVGEMNLLGGILKPSVAAITNIGTSHIEKFGSQEVIYREKTNIANSLIGRKKLLLNKDDKFLSNYKNSNVDIIYYSIEDAKNIVYNEDSIEFDTLIYNNMEHIKINCIGNHNILNSLVAIKIAQIYELKTQDIINGIASYQNYSRRMEKVECNGVTLIDDTYNASPDSTTSGLITINELNYKRKIAVIADILELGKYSKEIHENLAEVFSKVNFDYIIAYGQNMKYLAQRAKKYVENVYWYEKKEDVESKLKSIMQKGDVIYFKGSNSMKVNEIVNDIKNSSVE